MSKLQLKKELNGMSKEQLEELILDMYTARPDAKAYFEFFLNPDVQKLYDKYAGKIDAEFCRSKYRRSKARISKVKAAVKEFASFNPGSEYVVRLRLHALLAGVAAVRKFDYTRALSDSMLLFFDETVMYADNNLVFNEFKNGFERMVQQHEGLFDRSPGHEMLRRLGSVSKKSENVGGELSAYGKPST